MLINERIAKLEATIKKLKDAGADRAEYAPLEDMLAAYRSAVWSDTLGRYVTIPED